MSFLSKLFKNAPKNYFKINMADYEAVDEYIADGVLYNVFKQKDSKLHLIVNVDTNEVVGVKIGRFTY